MPTNEIDTFLEHFGKKGMKWGVRKRATPAGAATSKQGKPKATFLSDADLKKHINRMNLEKQYSDLSGKKKNNSEAIDFAKGLGKNIVSAAVMAVATKQIANVMKKVST
jgi:hypothetical protein